MIQRRQLEQKAIDVLDGNDEEWEQVYGVAALVMLIPTWLGATSGDYVALALFGAATFGTWFWLEYEQFLEE